jgi:quinol-cytochrome oxidoreductase complex cytochrome b subunit
MMSKGSSGWKAFLAAVVAAILIAIASAFALDWLDRSSANVYQTHQGNVRL